MSKPKKKLKKPQTPANYDVHVSPAEAFPSPFSPDFFLNAIKKAITIFLSDSPGRVMLSAKDIADKLVVLNSAYLLQYSNIEIQTRVGVAISKNKLGIPKKSNGKRYFIIQGVPDDTKGVPDDTKGVPGDAKGVPEGVPGDAKGVPEGVPGDAKGVPEGVPGEEPFDLAKNLDEVIREKQGKVPELIANATTDNYENAVAAIGLVEDRVKREEYLKQLSKRLGLPRKLFKDQVREFLAENKVAYKEPGKDESGFLEEYNKKYAVLTGKSCGILNTTFDDIVIYALNDFVHLLKANDTELVCNERGTLRETSKASLWVKHPRRREYLGIEFLPNGNSKGYYNLWKGFAIKPDAAAGKFDCFCELVNELICNGREEEQKFVWNWLAALIQFPERKEGTSIVIRGQKGCGKTVFGEVCEMLLGEYYLLANKEEDITGKFNAHLLKCLLVHFDEGFFAGNQKAAGIIKSIVTGKTHTMESKYKDLIKVKNYTRILMTSERERVCSADEKERRYAVFEISKKRQEDKPFFSALFKELETGGIKALMAHLLSIPISYRMPIPRNDALVTQQMLNLDAVQSYVVHLCSEAILPDLEGYWNTKNQAHEERLKVVTWNENEVTLVRKDAFFQHFMNIMPKTHYIHNPIQFTLRLSHILQAPLKILQPRERDRRRCYVFPPRVYIENLIEETLGIAIEKAEAEVSGT